MFGGAGGSFSSAGNGGGGGSSGFPLGGATGTSIRTDTTGAPSIAFTFTPGAAVVPVISLPVAGPVAPAAPTAAPDQCVVPKLGGRKLKGVRKGLGATHCKLGKVTRKKRGANRVVAQSPKPGTTLPAGSQVGVTLGR